MGGFRKGKNYLSPDIRSELVGKLSVSLVDHKLGEREKKLLSNKFFAFCKITNQFEEQSRKGEAIALRAALS